MRRFLVSCTLAMAVSVMAQSPAVPDRDWKRWMEDVKPLMTSAEKADAAKVSADARETFREAFWTRRNPGGQQAENPQRKEFEQRVASAEKRYRSGSSGPWNDCGRVFVLLGKPDQVNNPTSKTHFAASDRMDAFRDQDDSEGEVWLYRNPVRLPPTPLGYNLRFTPACESLNGPNFQRLLDTAAASYLVAR